MYKMNLRSPWKHGFTKKNLERKQITEETRLKLGHTYRYHYLYQIVMSHNPIYECGIEKDSTDRSAGVGYMKNCKGWNQNLETL